MVKMSTHKVEENWIFSVKYDAFRIGQDVVFPDLNTKVVRNIVALIPSTFALRDAQDNMIRNIPLTQVEFSCLIDVDSPSNLELKIEQIEQAVEACIGIVIKYPFAVSRLEIKVDDTPFTHPTRSNDWAYKVSIPHLLAEREGIYAQIVNNQSDAWKAWYKAFSKIIADENFFDKWLLPLVWLEKVYVSRHYDQLVSAWIAFNALFKLEIVTGGEKGGIKAFVSNKLGGTWSKDYLSRYNGDIVSLAVTPIGQTGFYNNDSLNVTISDTTKTSLEKMQVLLLTIYKIRNNIFHADWVYESSEHDEEVRLAADLMAEFLRDYFFTEVGVDLPNWKVELITLFRAARV
jgi:hypothetical protein